MTVKVGVHSLIVKFSPSNMPLLYLELHAAEPNGNNLQNMSLSEIEKAYDSVSAQIKETLGISYPSERRNTVELSSLELNRTFSVEAYPYPEFWRCVSLLGSAIGGTRIEISKAYNPNSFSKETMVYSRDSYEVRIYNKALELKKKNIHSPCDLMRVEMKYKNHQPIQTDFSDSLLVHLTQEMLENAYIKRFTAWKGEIYTYLRKKSQYNPLLSESDTTVANLIARYCSDGKISNPDLILAEIGMHEVKYSIPLLLDINDLAMSIANLQAAGILTPDIPIAKHCNAFVPAYDTSVYIQQVLRGQRKMLFFLLQKLTGAYCEEINLSM